MLGRMHHFSPSLMNVFHSGLHHVRFSEPGQPLQPISTTLKILRPQSYQAPESHSDHGLDPKLVKSLQPRQRYQASRLGSSLIQSYRPKQTTWRPHSGATPAVPSRRSSGSPQAQALREGAGNCRLLARSVYRYFGSRSEPARLMVQGERVESGRNCRNFPCQGLVPGISRWWIPFFRVNEKLLGLVCCSGKLRLQDSSSMLTRSNRGRFVLMEMWCCKIQDVEWVP